MLALGQSTEECEKCVEYVRQKMEPEYWREHGGMIAEAVRYGWTCATLYRISKQCKELEAKLKRNLKRNLKRTNRSEIESGMIVCACIALAAIVLGVDQLIRRWIGQ